MSRPHRDSPQYKRELYAVALIVTTLTLLGGALLGHKINKAEAMQEKHRLQAERYRMEHPGKQPPRARFVR